MSDKIKDILTRRFIDLTPGKYYRFFFSGKHYYYSGQIGRVDNIHNDHCIISGPDRGMQVARTFSVTKPNPSSIHRFGIYYWDYGFGQRRIYNDGEAPKTIGYSLVDGIQFVEELDINSDEEYYAYLESVKPKEENT